MDSNSAAFQLWAGSLTPNELAVRALRGEERLSEPFWFDVDFTTAADPFAQDPPLAGARASLLLGGGELGPRVIHGIVAGLEARGELYRLHLVPRLWFLGRRRASRIFQDKDVVEIVEAVLTEHRVARRWATTKRFTRRAYAAQYKETDYDFVARLLAEEGLFFYFESAGTVESGEDRLVLCEHASGYRAIDEALTSLPCVPDRGALSGAREAIYELDVRKKVASESVRLYDFDHERPLLKLEAALRLGDADPRTPGDDHAPLPQRLADAPVTGLPPNALEVYDHKSRFSDADVTPERAALELERHRARAVTLRGRSSCRRLAAGVRFRVDGHPSADLDGQELAVVRVSHRATAEGDGAYDNRFRCVAARVPFRPEERKVDLSHVLESATVVGPAGEAIHTDAHGRVKVQFHWDREGQRDEHSSCWLRVMSAWAGASWGFQFVPRVGMEVLVSFLGGDEDRPVVLGAVYNAIQPPPFPLPLARTKSGIKSHSVGGQGGSEISFEDGAGVEALTLQTSRDLLAHAGHDHALAVGNDDRVTVAGAQQLTVDGHRSVAVGGDETHAVAGARLTTVGGMRRDVVGGALIESVAGPHQLRVGGSSFESRGDAHAVVEGYTSLSVGTDEHPTGLGVTVQGHAWQDASEGITLRSDKRIVLEVGKTRIVLTPDGARVEGESIVLHAEKRIAILGDGPGIEIEREVEILGDKIRLFSQGGTVELDAEAAHIDGPFVKLNCGKGADPEIADEGDRPPTKPFRWRCLDRNLEPYAGKDYRLVAAGYRARGVTKPDGIVAEDIPADALVAELTLWPEKFPSGERLHYAIRLVDLPPTSSIYGALVRLRNLGYYAGADADEMTLDLAAALSAFQADHHLATTGELDGATVAKLDEIHVS